jgi:hypothetical protein
MHCHALPKKAWGCMRLPFLQPDTSLTPLLVAAANGHLAALQKLVKAGADMTALTEVGWVTIRSHAW